MAVALDRVIVSTRHLALNVYYTALAIWRQWRGFP
jgi:hypothetical protein